MWSFSGRGLWLWVFSLVHGNADLWEAFVILLEKQSFVVAALYRSLPSSSSGSLVGKSRGSKRSVKLWICLSCSTSSPFQGSDAVSQKPSLPSLHLVAENLSNRNKDFYHTSSCSWCVQKSRFKLNPFIRYLKKYFRQERDSEHENLILLSSCTSRSKKSKYSLQAFFYFISLGSQQYRCPKVKAFTVLFSF